MVVGFTTTCVITKVVNLNSTHGKVYSIQNFVIKFVSELWQVRGFLRILQFPPPMKLTAMYNITEIFLKAMLLIKTITPVLKYHSSSYQTQCVANNNVCLDSHSCVILFFLFIISYILDLDLIDETHCHIQ
jgi:hypothetical protein